MATAGVCKGPTNFCILSSDSAIPEMPSLPPQTIIVQRPAKVILTTGINDFASTSNSFPSVCGLKMC